MPELLTVPEAAKLLRVSRSTAWRWCKDGILTSAFKIGQTCGNQKTRYGTELPEPGLSNIAATLCMLLGLTPPADYDPSLIALA